MRRSESAVLSAVWPLLGDDLGHHFRRYRLDIGGVGQFRIGHDRGRIGVDQDDAKTLFLQRLAGLGAGIVELARLADDDGAGPDDQDRLDVGASWHVSWIPFGERLARKTGTGRTRPVVLAILVSG